MTDKEIQQAVLRELEWEPQVKSTEVGVAAKDGVVTLTGFIDSYAKKFAAERDARRISVETTDGKVILHGTVRAWVEREEAERAAWSAPGVKQVEDHILVAP